MHIKEFFGINYIIIPWWKQHEKMHTMEQLTISHWRKGHLITRNFALERYMYNISQYLIHTWISKGIRVSMNANKVRRDVPLSSMRIVSQELHLGFQIGGPKSDIDFKGTKQ